MRIDVDLQISEELNTEIQEPDILSDTELGIGTYVVGIDPDYEKMKNKPAVNSNTLVGDKTTAELGIMLVGTYNNEELTLGMM
jgi:hypothetical protein